MRSKRQNEYCNELADDTQEESICYIDAELDECISVASRDIEAETQCWQSALQDCSDNVADNADNVHPCYQI